MANSYVTYTGNGSTTQYNVPFSFLSRSHVHAYLAGVETTAFTWISNSLIQFNSAPGNGVAILIQRETPTTPLTDFVDGSTLTDGDLDNALLQSLYVAEESADRANDALNLDTAATVWDAKSKKIDNVAEPTASDHAATKSYVDSFVAGTVADGTMTNAKLADMLADRIKGRANGAGTGAPQDLTATQVRTLLGMGDLYAENSPLPQAKGGSGATSLGSGTITATGSTTARSLAARFAEVLNVKDFGATGDGVTDDSAAFTAAVAALPAAGGIIYCPAGIYQIAPSITVDKPALFLGAGKTTTTFRATAANGDVFNVTAAGVAFTNFQFTSSVTRTSGSYINFASGAHRGRVENFLMSGYYRGVTIVSCVGVLVSNGEMRDGTPNGTAAAGACVVIGGAAGNQCTHTHINNLLADAASEPMYGILVVNSDALMISNCDIINHGDCLAFRPGDGQLVAASLVANSYFDNSTYGFRSLQSGTGNVIRNAFSNCYFGSHAQNGINLGYGGSGTASGMSFVNCSVVLNGAGVSGDGAVVASSAWTDVAFLGGVYAQNGGSGISIAADTNRFTIRGVRAGANDGLTGNAFGIGLNAGTSTDWAVEHNMLVGNVLGAIFFGAITGAVGRLNNNIGYNPVGPSAITVGASPFTYTAGYAPETVYIRGGTVSDIKHGGTTIFAATEKSVHLGPGEAIVVTYSSAPTMVKYIH